MDGLLTMATQSTDDVLALVLESLRIVMSVRKTTQVALLEIYEKDNPKVLKQCTCMFTEYT